MKKTIYLITFARKLTLMTMSREEEDEIDNRNIIISNEQPLIVDNSQSIENEEEEGGREYFCFLGISMTIMMIMVMIMNSLTESGKTIQDNGPLRGVLMLKEFQVQQRMVIYIF